MNLRLATKNDLNILESIFLKIVENMNDQNIKIWNEYYPFEEFEIDIQNQNLYVLEDKNTIIGAFALLETISAEDNFEWTTAPNYIYLSRLGVNTNFLRQGIASKLIEYAKQIAKEKNKNYLRLTVADINQPAINLYVKHGFHKVNGQFCEYSEALNVNIIESGYELKL